MPLSLSFRKNNKTSLSKNDLDTTSSSGSEDIVETPTLLNEILGQLETALATKQLKQRQVEEAEIALKKAAEEKANKKEKKALLSKATDELKEAREKLAAVKHNVTAESKKITQEFQEVIDNISKQKNTVRAAMQEKGGAIELYRHDEETKEGVKEAEQKLAAAQAALQVVEAAVALPKEQVETLVAFFKNLTNSTENKRSEIEQELNKVQGELCLLNKAAKEVKAEVAKRKAEKQVGILIERADTKKVSVQDKLDSAKKKETSLANQLQELKQEHDELAVIFPDIETQQQLLSQIYFSVTKSERRLQADTISLASSVISESSVEPQVSSAAGLTQNMAAVSVSTPPSSSSTAASVAAPVAAQAPRINPQPIAPRLYELGDPI